VSVKPGDLFVGIVDFFAVILPGMILVFIAQRLGLEKIIFGQDVLTPGILFLGDAEKWIAFVIAAYLVGHFVLAIGSSLDTLYDIVRQRVVGKKAWNEIFFRHDAGRIVGESRLTMVLKSWLAIPLCVIFTPLLGYALRKEKDENYRYALQIRNRALPDANAQVINTFRWAKAVIQTRQPALIVEVQRLEGDSKFFRSLILVLGIILIVLVVEGRWLAVLGSLVLMVLSFWRYSNRRWTSTELAYDLLIALEHAPPHAEIPPTPGTDD
jgi:hypothetical protein